MFDSLPASIQPFMDWPWEKIELYYRDLQNRPLTAESLAAWMSDWTRLSDLVGERSARLSVAVTIDTTDSQAEARYNDYLDNLRPKVQAAEQKLKERLLVSGLEPENFHVPLSKMRTEAAIFRAANLPLLSQESKLGSEYNKIIGAQTVRWDGEELTVQQMRRYLQHVDRSVRERSWRLVAERQLEDRLAINQLWERELALRRQLAANADLPFYRDYRWRQMLRLDYTPQDCVQFQQAIEQVVVPAARRLYERFSQQIRVSSVRPWDLDGDLIPLVLPPLPSYGDLNQLASHAEATFQRVDPQLGGYFHEMRQEGLLDLDNHKGKAPGAYCTAFPVTRRPFIFMNAVGLSADVRTILHESGHAFHNYERLQLPYSQQRYPGLEFAEVASMAMELLASPYLDAQPGGFYPPEAARRFRIVHLQQILTFWPYMAVVDAFQHWVYTHPEQAASAVTCDAKWLELWWRYLPGVDWNGLEEAAMTGWHRKQHIHRSPFYYVEYGLAQLGAVQVWRNSLHDPAKALAQYRHALSLGGTVSLPELYQAAGARLSFDAETLGEAVELIEETIRKLEAELPLSPTGREGRG